MKKSSTLKILAGGFALLFISGCFSPSGNSIADKKKRVQAMRIETLNRLYQLRPETREVVKNSMGYGVFSNVGTYLLFVSTGSGWGIVRDNQTGKNTYMSMVSLGVGLGLGIKDFRGVIVFTTKEALNNFVEQGFTGQAQVDAAAKSGNKGGAFAEAVEIAPGIRLYQITENGLALQATLQGTKFWKDDELN